MIKVCLKRTWGTEQLWFLGSCIYLFVCLFAFKAFKFISSWLQNSFCVSQKVRSSTELYKIHPSAEVNSKETGPLSFAAMHLERLGKLQTGRVFCHLGLKKPPTLFLTSPWHLVGISWRGEKQGLVLPLACSDFSTVLTCGGQGSPPSFSSLQQEPSNFRVYQNHLNYPRARYIAGF